MSGARSVRAGARFLGALLCLVCAAAPAAAQHCPEGNLLAGLEARGEALDGRTEVATDGVIAREGWPTGVPEAIRLHDRRSRLQVDLGAPRSLRALLLQGDAADSFLVEGSHDGWEWQPIWLTGRVPGDGLRVRRTLIDGVPPFRYLQVRVEERGGGGALSEVRAWCSVPEGWNEASPAFYAPGPRRWLTASRLRGIKAALAGAALLLFVWGAALLRAGRPELDGKLRSGLLLALALVSGLAWWNLGKFNFDAFVHHWDQFHYFVGSKYAKELGYTGLYDCAAAVDAEDGLFEQLGRRKIRDLETNRLKLADPAAIERCRERFTPERWESFGADVRWYRGAMPPQWWPSLFRDHGYNATPLWEAFGARLTGMVRAGPGVAVALAWIDQLLILAMWGAVFWAFGWRPAAVALLWWGTNQVAGYTWTGGSLLRFDWLALSVIGVCLVRRGKMAAGGFLLAWATLLRIFPGFLVAALVLKALAGMWERRSFRPEPAHGRFAAGCIAALLLLVPLSFTARGPGAWAGFVENSRVHLSTPGTNTIGLGAVLGYDRDTRREVMRDPTREDPDLAWREARDATLDRRRPLQWLLLAGFLALLTAAAARQPDWVALLLGIGLLPFATTQSGYYYAIFLGFGLLYGLRRPGIATALCALSLWTWFCRATWGSGVANDQQYYWISLGTLCFVAAVTAAKLRRQSAAASPPPLPTGSP